MKHLGIYFIATSNYKTGFQYFQKNLHLLYPEMKKTVIILSDGLEEWDGIVEGNTSYIVHKIPHYPWPIITLFKMKYILDYRIPCDYICYVNGNLQINPKFDFSKINEYIDLDKLNVTRHSWYLVDTFEDKNGSAYDKGLKKESRSYIPEPYIYIQAAFFIGPTMLVRRMCEDVCNMCEADLKENIIPNYHDESYLNRYIYVRSKEYGSKSIVYPPRKLIHPSFDYKYPFALIDTFIKDRYLFDEY